jgi:hypothetical protein
LVAGKISGKIFEMFLENCFWQRKLFLKMKNLKRERMFLIYDFFIAVVLQLF